MSYLSTQVDEASLLASLLAIITLAKEENDWQGVVDAMREGASNAGVAKQGCRALWSLANNNADNKKSIAEAGGIVMILRMLDVHGESNAGVAQHGCNALWNLIADAPNTEIIGEPGSINAENKRKILAANGESMVERMKSTWASNAEVQEMADGALAILCN